MRKILITSKLLILLIFGSLVVLSLNSASAASADHIYVNGSSGNDSWNGLTPETAKLTTKNVTASVKAGGSVSQTLSDNTDFVRMGTKVEVDSVTNFGGQTITISAHVTDENNNNVNNGLVTFIINAEKYTFYINNGLASFTGVIPRDWYSVVYPITAKYDGTGTIYENSTGTGGLKVTKTPTSLTVDDVKGDSGDTVNLHAHLTDYYGSNISGATITFYMGSVAVIGTTDFNGDAIISYIITKIPDKSFTANFDGNKIFNSSSTTGSLIIDRLPTTITVQDLSSVHGDKVILKAVLKDKNDNQLADKTITFVINGQTIGAAVTDSNGSATLSYIIKQTIGNYNITANFEYDDIYAASTNGGILKVYPISTHLLVDDVTGKEGGHINLTAVLKDENNSLLSNKIVAFAINGQTIGTAVTDSTGSAKLSYIIKQTIGNYNITAYFEQDDIYAASTNRGILKVNPISTHLMVSNVTGKYGGHINFTAVLKDEDNNPLSDKTITFTINGQTIGTAVTDGNGSATLSYIIKQTIGNYNITANFKQDAFDVASTNNGTLKVNPTSTHLLVDDVTGKHGDHINLTAVLKDEDNSPLSGKTIIFYLNGDKIGSKTTDSTGSAKLSYIIKQTIGNYNITAYFEQDDIYAASTNIGTLKVNPTNTKFVVKNITVKNGDKTNLKAVLKDELGNPVSGKTINFTINSKIIGKAITDVNGTANMYLITHSSGNFIVNTIFTGDTIYSGSNGTGKLNVTPWAKLNIKTTINVKHPQVGKTFTINFKLGNKGPDTAKEVVVSFKVPEGLKFVTGTSDYGKYKFDTRTKTLTWKLDKLVVGDPNLKITLKAIKSAKYTIKPKISANTTTKITNNGTINIQIIKKQ
jgi:hypothetical protein